MPPEKLREVKDTFDEICHLKQKIQTVIKTLDKKGVLEKNLEHTIRCARSLEELEIIVSIDLSYILILILKFKSCEKIRFDHHESKNILPNKTLTASLEKFFQSKVCESVFLSSTLSLLSTTNLFGIIDFKAFAKGFL